MASIFKVYGPFEVPYTNGKSGAKIIKKENVVGFWSQHSRFAGKIGCYVFAIKHYKLLPWYVGKATVKFKQECFTDGKRVKYNEALAEEGKGKPYIFFVSRRRAKGPVATSHIGQLEKFLIRQCYTANEKIKNTQHILAEVNWIIEDVTVKRKGRPTTAASLLRETMRWC